MQRRERSYNTHMHSHNIVIILTPTVVINNESIMSARRKESKRQQKAILPAAPPASGIWHSQRKSVADRCTHCPPSHFVREFRRLAVLVGTFHREAQAQGHEARKLARRAVFISLSPLRSSSQKRVQLGKMCD
jgi:hypothetical protein